MARSGQRRWSVVCEVSPGSRGASSVRMGTPNSAAEIEGLHCIHGDQIKAAFSALARMRRNDLDRSGLHVREVAADFGSIWPSAGFQGGSADRGAALGADPTPTVHRPLRRPLPESSTTHLSGILCHCHFKI